MTDKQTDRPTFLGGNSPTRAAVHVQYIAANKRTSLFLNLHVQSHAKVRPISQVLFNNSNVSKNFRFEYESLKTW